MPANIINAIFRLLKRNNVNEMENSWWKFMGFMSETKPHINFNFMRIMSEPGIFGGRMRYLFRNGVYERVCGSTLRKRRMTERQK